MIFLRNTLYLLLFTQFHFLSTKYRFYRNMFYLHALIDMNARSQLSASTWHLVLKIPLQIIVRFNVMEILFCWNTIFRACDLIWFYKSFIQLQNFDRLLRKSKSHWRKTNKKASVLRSMWASETQEKCMLRCACNIASSTTTWASQTAQQVELRCGRNSASNSIARAS